MQVWKNPRCSQTPPGKAFQSLWPIITPLNVTKPPTRRDFLLTVLELVFSAEACRETCHALVYILSLLAWQMYVRSATHFLVVVTLFGHHTGLFWDCFCWPAFAFPFKREGASSGFRLVLMPPELVWWWLQSPQVARLKRVEVTSHLRGFFFSVFFFKWKEDTMLQQTNDPVFVSCFSCVCF